MPSAGNRYVHLFAALCLSLALPLGTLAQDVWETDAEIQYLLEFVATSQCSFIRNGNLHKPADAADHLRLKYSRGKKHVNSAEQFIERLASESSWSGQPYTVVCNGTTQPSKEWLYRALGEYRKKTATKTISPPVKH